MQAYHELLGRMACPTACLAVQVDERPEAAWLATDDRHHERQSEHARSNEGLRGAADAEPDRQRRLHRARVHTLSGQPADYLPDHRTCSGLSRMCSSRSSFSAKRES